MGPEDSKKKAVKFYMMVDGEPVEISPEIAEITYSEDRQGDNVLPLQECEITVDAHLTAPLILIHGRMIYRCENCGKSWPMYLEKGIEEFGENHKPSPFTIKCPYCGGWAMDVLGIQKVPGGGYVPLPDGCRYFANLEDKDCGVPMLYETGTAPSGAKIVAIGLDQHNRRQQDWQTVDKEVLEDIQACVKKYIDDFIAAEFAELAGEEVRELAEAAGIFAEMSSYSLAEVMEAMANAFNGGVNPKQVRRAFFGLATAWDRKELREKQRAVERETASRFRQYKAGENAWATRKRTGPRRREWRGPART